MLTSAATATELANDYDRWGDADSEDMTIEVRRCASGRLVCVSCFEQLNILHAGLARLVTSCFIRTSAKRPRAARIHQLWGRRLRQRRQLPRRRLRHVDVQETTSAAHAATAFSSGQTWSDAGLQQHPVCTAKPFAALTRRQKRFETALDCLRGLGVPIVGQGERASHVLCCCDEWQLHQGQQREQEVPVVIDALQFSLHPPYKLYQTLLP